MSDAATARHIAMLERLTDCAADLAVVAHDLALALRTNPDRFLALAAESRQCGLAARMGIRLIQRLMAGRAAPLPARAEAPEREPSGRPERDRPEAEREGESEPAPSLPLFLKTLRGVAAGAERRLADPAAADRERLQARLDALLAEQAAFQMPAPAPKRDHPGGGAVLTRPPPPSRSTRAGLLASAGGLDLRRDSS